MSLLLLLPLLVLTLFALFWGGTLVLQGYLYQAPADRLPYRALGAAALVGGFLTLWVAIDKRYPRRYDTLFEFAPYTTRTFDEFEAIRWLSPDGRKLKMDEGGRPVEVVVRFKRGIGDKANQFFQEGTNDPFRLNGVTRANESYMTAAIRLKPDPAGEEVIRLNAVLRDDPRSSVRTYAPERRFVEENGSRYVEAEVMGTLFIPSTSTVVLALLLNLTHFAVWFAAFWVILQFTRGHALALTVIFGLVTMLLVLPLLFQPNRQTAGSPPAVAGQHEERMGQRGGPAS